MGDGIGGPVVKCVSGNAFELDVTHYRKDNKEQYSKIEKIIISKIDNPDNPEYRETTQVELEQALKGKFVSCNVQYRDENTDALVCNVFVQKPPDGF
jgi:alanyl-tRNA synthetase